MATEKIFEMAFYLVLMLLCINSTIFFAYALNIPGFGIKEGGLFQTTMCSVSSSTSSSTSTEAQTMPGTYLTDAVKCTSNFIITLTLLTQGVQTVLTAIFFNTPFIGLVNILDGVITFISAGAFLYLIVRAIGVFTGGF